MPAPVVAEPIAVDTVVELEVASQKMLDQAQPEPEGPAFTAKAQILPGSEAAAERKDSSPPSSELSTGKMNPRAPGWNKRLRTVAATPSRPPCPNRTSAFEKAVRSYAENPTENVITPTVGTSFDSVGEAYDFYNLYSWEKGFGIRYGKSRLNVERTKCMQEIVCGCSGKAGVENTRSCRCECPALIMAGPMHQRQVANATTAVSRQMPLMQVPRASGVARPHLLVCNRQKEMKMKWGISCKRSQKWKLLL